MSNYYYDDDITIELGKWLNRFQSGLNGKGWSRKNLQNNPYSPMEAICTDESTNKFLKLNDEWDNLIVNTHPNIFPEFLIESPEKFIQYDKKWFSLNPNLTTSIILKYPNGINNNEWNPIQLHKKGLLKELYCNKNSIQKNINLWKSRGFGISWKIIKNNPNGINNIPWDMKWISIKNGSVINFNKNLMELNWDITGIIMNTFFDINFYMKKLEKNENDIKLHFCHKDLNDENEIEYRCSTIPILLNSKILSIYLDKYIDICHPKFIENLKYNPVYSIF